MPFRQRLSVLVALAAALSAWAVLAGCAAPVAPSVDEDSGGRPTRPAPTPSSTTRPAPGALPPNVVRLASGRIYVLPNQPDVDPRATRPLLVVLHSFGGTWTRLERAARFLPRAKGQGLAVAYGIGRDRSWNAGSCCGWAQSHEENDLKYLVDLVSDVQRRVPDIDGRRIYLTGFSNGAMMTLRAVCERPDVFAAGVGVAGALVGRCAGGSPVHYLEIHGTVDDVVPYAGGKVPWLGLSFAPVRSLPDRIRSQAPGSVAEVRSYPCGHVWPTAGPCRVDATAAVLSFVRRFALDQAGEYHVALDRAPR